MKRITQIGVGLVMVLLLSGCGSGIKVEGNVTFEGKPIDNGSISFEPTQGSGRGFGGEITNGKYQLTAPSDTPPGSLTVRIRAAVKTGKQIPAGSPYPEGTMVDEVLPLPDIYNDKSTLTVTLEPGKNNPKDFNLK